MSIKTVKCYNIAIMMNPTKAQKLLREYKLNNFNAKKTLLENGYTEMTAEKKGKEIMGRAQRVVNDQLQLTNTDIKETATDVFDLVGFSREDVIKELQNVVIQNRDFTNKLKAMKPLLDALNYHLEDDNNQKAPSVNITVEKVDTSNSPRVIDSN